MSTLNEVEFNEAMQREWAKLPIHSTRPSILTVEWVDNWRFYTAGMRWKIGETTADVHSPLWLLTKPDDSEEDKANVEKAVECVMEHTRKLLSQLANVVAFDMYVRVVYDQRHCYALFPMAYCGTESWLRPLAVIPM